MQAIYILHFDIPVEDWKLLSNNKFGGNLHYVTLNVEKYCPLCLGIYGKSQYKAGWSKLLNAV